jgi:hypothetical protein
LRGHADSPSDGFIVQALRSTRPRRERLRMDGIPPSICPTVIYRPPQQSPSDSGIRPLPGNKDRPGIVGWLSTVMRKLVRALRNQEAGR